MYFEFVPLRDIFQSLKESSATCLQLSAAGSGLATSLRAQACTHGGRVPHTSSDVPYFLARTCHRSTNSFTTSTARSSLTAKLVPQLVLCSTLLLFRCIIQGRDTGEGQQKSRLPHGTSGPALMEQMSS